MGTAGSGGRGRRMVPLHWLVLVLAPLAVAQPAPPNCCATKTVGGVDYTFVREDSAAMSYSCLSSCVYERDDQPGTSFCFAQGDQQVVCGDSTQGISADDLEMECDFSMDCWEFDYCRNIADAWCVCRLGSCVLDGGFPIPGDPGCSNYTDCDCRDSPSTCFCRGWPAMCDTRAWECHTSEDCRALDKCADKECGCHSNLCEHECDTANDCIEIGHHCSSTDGYSCTCEQSVCNFERDPEPTEP